ncbi:ABC transporter permease [Candidatus Calescamantes bacterium]|nr:ABC transporter permease [Candidatus Calescamantes bacterium]
MKNYIFRRLLGMIPMLLGISIITFTVIHLSPGKPTDIATSLNPKVSLEARERLAKLYGLDKPLYIQYFTWLKRMVRLDFGNSFTDGRNVLEKIGERLPVTLTLNILSLLLIAGVAIPLGVLAAVKQRSFLDRLTTIIVFVGFATPSFWLALLLMYFFGVKLGWLPISGLYSWEFSSLSLGGKIIDLAKHLILPVFVASFGGLAGFSRYTRSNMLEVIQQDYIRTGRAKGLPERVVVYRHALKNAILPVVTILGLSLPGLIGGSVIMESIFAIPGMGRLFYESVMSRDYPVVMGILTIGAFLTLLGNLIADILYAWVDPRIKYS